MEGMRSGRVWLACLSVFFTLHVCLASLTVQVKPTVDVILGETARMPCSSTKSEGVVQWFIETTGTRKRVAFRSPTDHAVEKDGPFAGRVTMEADMTLVISSVKVLDERSFFCQVDGGAVGTSEAESKLRVFLAPAKPVVSENNHHIPLTPDNPTTHQVGKCTSSNSHPEPRIIWFKDSKPLPDRTDSKEPIYMVPGVVKESSGLFTVTSSLYIQPNKTDAKSVFQCTVEYRMPNDMIKKENSEPFNLTLLYPTENVFFKVLNTSQIKEGDDVHMKCETDGNPQPHFEFTRNETIKQSEDGLFIVHNVTRNDLGTYQCEALDFDATTADLVKTLNLKVNWLDPVSVVPASPLNVNKGDPIELQCRTKSSTEYTLSWMKNGKQLSQKGGLTVQSAKLDDAGVYVCIASVPSVPGLQKQASIEIIVSGQPEIDEPKPVNVKRQGEMVTLMCSAQGHPAPQFTWKPSGKESVNINGNKFTSTVTLEATAAVLKDGVTCEVNNEHGSDSKKFTVEIQSDNTVDPNGGERADTQEGGSRGVVVAVLVCVLLLLILVAVLYFLGKRGRMACRKKEKKEVASGDVNNDIVVEMKSGEKPNEESGLLNKPRVEQ